MISILSWVKPHPRQAGCKKRVVYMLRDNEVSFLNLCDRGIAEQDLIPLSKCLETNASLETLNLSCNPNLRSGVKSLALCLEHDNCSLKHLLLGYRSAATQDSENTTVAMGTMLEYNTSLIMLCLDNNGLNDTSMANLAMGLGCNVSLAILNLNSNRIGDDGVAAIARAIGENQHCRLATLLLKQNHIGDKGARSLSDMLCTNTSLKELSLKENPGIAQKGAKALTEALQSNYFLKQLLVDLQDESLVYANEIKYYLALNRVGRGLLRNGNVMTAGLLPFFLSKAGRDTKFGPSLVYYFLTKDIDQWWDSSDEGEDIGPIEQQQQQQPQWLVSLNQTSAQARQVCQEARLRFVQEARKREGAFYKKVPTKEQ